jgi:small subunit ribosomal protein S11e
MGAIALLKMLVSTLHSHVWPPWTRPPPPRPAILPSLRPLGVTVPPPLLHHTVSDAQTQRAFQKQDAVFVGRKRALGKNKNKKKLRWYKDVGLGFKTPKEASSGTYIDKKCPFTGNVSIRGRILKGIVISTKMQRSIVIRRNYLNFVPKYRRFEKRHKNITCHCSPAFRVKEGDIVSELNSGAKDELHHWLALNVVFGQGLGTPLIMVGSHI